MLKKLLKDAFGLSGKEIVSAEEIKELREIKRALDPALALYQRLAENERKLIAPFLPLSKGQLAQDLLALSKANTLEPRFFVEFGATDGITLSNTWLLEKHLGWNGILAEPARAWQNALVKNRSCSIDIRCVSSVSGQQCNFLEVQKSVDCKSACPELSTQEKYAENEDWASMVRSQNALRYLVETVSLHDLLDYHNAPPEIEFMSIDTEGSELEILEAYNFKSRRIHTICVEHNYRKKIRGQINDLLTKNGYNRVYADLSLFDDWYILS